MNIRTLGKVSVFAVALLFLMVTAVCALSAESNEETGKYRAVDQYVQERMKSNRIPGGALGIVQDGRIVYLKGYGVADDTGRKVTPQTPFLLASVTKSFTAVCIMQLVSEGNLKLDAPVRQYLPWFRTANPEAASKITIRELLNHTSGFSTIQGREPFVNSRLKGEGLEAYARSLGEAKLIAPPGNRYEYSNTNYCLLGLIIQKVSGLSYENYVRKNVFEPLEMRHSHTSPAEARADHGSAGYYPYFGFPFAADRIPLARAIVSAAGIFSSAEDMTHYLIAQLNEGRYDTVAIVPASAMAEMHRPAVRVYNSLYYAMGWSVQPIRGKNAIWHDGDGPRFHAFALLVPEKGLGVVWLINTGYPPAGLLFDSIGFGIADTYMGFKPVSLQTYAPFVVQYVRPIFAVLLILLVGGMLWTIRWLQPARSEADLKPKRRNRRLAFVLLYALMDFAIAFYLLTVLLPRNDMSVQLLLYSVPDVGWLLIAILVLTLGWGVVRTGLVLRSIYKTLRLRFCG